MAAKKRYPAKLALWVYLGFGALSLAPAVAAAETRTFYESTALTPVQGAGTSGPAEEYPSSIVVSGVEGTVTDLDVTFFGYESSSPDDTDAAIVGPNGRAVMLMSDACGESSGMTAISVENTTWTFDDSAPTFLPDNGPCPQASAGTFKPSNYQDPALDNLAVNGGPAPPYTNALAGLTGGSPNGEWRLFVLDDNNFGFRGFYIGGWGLRMEIEPPPVSPSALNPPDTQITDGPPRKTKQRLTSFSFASTEPGSTFECKVDDAAFSACSSPFEAKVSRAKHVFEVRAVGAGGKPDAWPASQGWKVKKKK